MQRYVSFSLLAGAAALFGIWFCDQLPVSLGQKNDDLARCLIADATLEPPPERVTLCRSLFVGAGVVRSQENPSIAYVPRVAWFDRSRFLSLYLTLSRHGDGWNAPQGDFEAWWRSLPTVQK